MFVPWKPSGSPKLGEGVWRDYKGGRRGGEVKVVEWAALGAGTLADLEPTSSQSRTSKGTACRYILPFMDLRRAYYLSPPLSAFYL